MSKLKLFGVVLPAALLATSAFAADETIAVFTDRKSVV